MNESDYYFSRRSAEQNSLDRIHQAQMTILIDQQDLVLFSTLKPKIYKDGGSWCVLMGDNLQEGICGFGDSPIKAIYDFNKKMKENINPY